MELAIKGDSLGLFLADESFLWVRFSHRLVEKAEQSIRRESIVVLVTGLRV